MDLSFDDHYPTGTARGADFFTGADQGDVIEETPEGLIRRRERVLITSVYLDADDLVPGRVCIGERTVRHLAHTLGLVDEWRFKRVCADNEKLRDEVKATSERAQTAEDRVRFLELLERQEPPTVYVALDGSRHTSERAATEASRDWYVGKARDEVELVPTAAQEAIG